MNIEDADILVAGGRGLGKAEGFDALEELVEAIGLGHDVGHPPFGHIGEDVLDACRRERFGEGFRHNEHSLRVVDVLEDLNLTEPVRDGILRHSSRAEEPATLEGKIVRLVDRIAYINHDIDDAVRAGLLTESDLPAETVEVLGTTHGERITRMVMDLVIASEGAGQIAMSEPVFAAMGVTRSFLFEHVYLGRVASATQTAVKLIVGTLLDHYLATLSDRVSDPREAAVDYVAGMTDRFALRAFEEIVGSPSPALRVLG